MGDIPVLKPSEVITILEAMGFLSLGRRVGTSSSDMQTEGEFLKQK